MDRYTENLKILIQSMASEVTLKKKAKVLKSEFADHQLMPIGALDLEKPLSMLYCGA